MERVKEEDRGAAVFLGNILLERHIFPKLGGVIHWLVAVQRLTDFKALSVGCSFLNLLLQQPVTSPAEQSNTFSSQSITFTSKDVAVARPSNFRQGWPVCDARGTVLLQFLQDRGLEHDETLARLPHGIGMTLGDDGQTQLFPYDTIRGLYYSQVRDVDLNDDEVLFHLWATAGQDETDHSALNAVPREQGPAKTAPADHFIALFKRDGKFVGAERLDLPFNVVHIALLAGGQLLAVGVDQTHSKPIFALVDDTGHLKRYLDSNAGVPTSAEFLSGLSEDEKKIYPEGASESVRLGSALSGYFSYHHGRDVLFMDRGSRPTVLVVSGVSVRTVRLSVPTGLVARAIVLSDGGDWIVRTYGADESEAPLIAFDPETGRAKREIQTGEVPSSAVTCIVDGTYLALRFRSDSDKTSILRGR